mgnify:CR=1 FL=1
MMECKAALTEAKGDIAEAEVVLRKKGIASAGKKATRATKQGVIGTYIHPGSQLGVLIEVNCESDFVARTDDFQELVRDLDVTVRLRKNELQIEHLTARVVGGHGSATFSVSGSVGAGSTGVLTVVARTAKGAAVGHSWATVEILSGDTVVAHLRVYVLVA